MDNNKSNLAIKTIEKAFQQIADTRDVGKNDLLIWGGHFSQDQLPLFLQAWDNTPHCAWAMVEEVSRFYVKRVATPANALPQPAYLLQRMRLFGLTGDLDIRRDGDTIYWHFIGETGGDWKGVDLDGFSVADFWQEATEPPTLLREVEQRYFQWLRDMPEQRVTSHWVPQDEPNKTFNYLRQLHYLDNGRIAFVRYVDFEEVDA